MLNPQATPPGAEGDTGTPHHRCPAFAFNLCCALRPDMNGAAGMHAADIKIAARRTIWRERASVDGVPILCQGWAATVASTSDGRRQILSFVLPGELISAALVSAPVVHYAVEAITDLRYRLFRRDDIRTALARDPSMVAALTSLWADENARAEQLAVDLGQRTAPERIARLILNLAGRLAQRGLMQNGTVEFPLRQYHIADATGLTPVHVGKVLVELRRAGFVEITDRSLTLTNPGELRRLAGLH